MDSVAPVFLVASLALAGCGGEPDTEHLEYLEETASIDCGSYEVDGCPGVPTAALTCMRDALSEREAARLEQSFVTDEGGVVVEDLFAAETAFGWGVVRIVDSRDDPWGSQTVEETHCDGVARSGPTVSGCQYVVATECTE